MGANRRMNGVGRTIVLIAWLSSCLLLGCYRSGPPMILEFRPPPKVVLKATPLLVAADEAPGPVAEEPEPEPESGPVQTQPVAAPPPEPEPEPEFEEAIDEGPSIYGTWRMTEMSRSGQAIPQPEGMVMTITLAEDGSLTMSMSMPQLPEPQITEGSFEVDGDRITLQLGQETLSGTYTFTDDDNVSLDLGVMQITLTRG